MSRAVLERKMDSLAAADPDLVVSGNPGCLMQLRAGLAGRGLRAEAIHPMDLLDRAYAGVRR
jgi:glycolate oxidase iron-sulfur subunit